MTEEEKNHLFMISGASVRAKILGVEQRWFHTGAACLFLIFSADTAYDAESNGKHYAALIGTAVSTLGVGLIYLFLAAKGWLLQWRGWSPPQSAPHSDTSEEGIWPPPPTLP